MTPPAGLEPGPRSLDLCRERCGDQPAERPGDPGRGRGEPHAAVRSNLDNEAPRLCETVYDVDRGRLERPAVVGQRKPPKRLPRPAGPPDVGRPDADVPCEQTVVDQPAPKTGR